MHTFESNGVTYEWRIVGKRQVELYAFWVEGPYERQAVLLLLSMDEFKKLLELGMDVLKDIGKEP